MRLRFRVISSELKGLQFDTDTDRVRVGRSSKNELVLRLPSVSRHHATIYVRDGQPFLEDAGSHNETRLDGEVLGDVVPLANGAIVSFSDVMVQVTFPDLEPESAEDTEVTPQSGVPAPGPAVSEKALAENALGSSLTAGMGLEGEDENSPIVGGPTPGEFQAAVDEAAEAEFEAEVVEEAPAEPGKSRRMAAVPESWFEPAAAAPPGDESEPGGGGLAPAPTPAPPVGSARGERLERRLWPFIALVSGITAAVAFTLWFLDHSSPDGSGARGAPVAERGAVVNVGEEKIIEVPAGFVYNPQIADGGLFTIRRAMGPGLAVAVKGEAEGFTSVKLHRSSGKAFLLLHVRVLPRRKQVADQFLQDQELPPAQKQRLADECMIRARAREQDGRLYEAKIQLLRALSLCRSLADEGGKRRAIEALDKIDDRMDEQYWQLTFEMGQWLKDGDMKMGAVKLNELKELLPDESDVRRQNVDLLYRLLLKEIEKAKKSKRRGM